MNITVGTPLKDFFMGVMGDCRYAELLSEKLANAGFDNWVSLEPKLRKLAQRRFTTPEKLIEDELFGAENADEFMKVLQS